MSFGMLAATLLQTGFIIAFILILTPFRLPTKKALTILGGLMAVLIVVTSVLAARFGTTFLMHYGFYMIGIPLFLSVYFFSRARGIRFLFVAMTAVVFHQMLLILLMAFRIHEGGFTILYFLLNLLAFGALLGGGIVMRRDYHKIVLSYRYEFICLCAILFMLFLFSAVFSPITAANTVDPDLFLITLFLDLLIVLLYFYIGVSFHSLGKRIDMEKDALSLRFQMEEADNNLDRMKLFQKHFFEIQQQRQQNITALRTFLEAGELSQLQSCLDEMESKLFGNLQETGCQNEAVNLFLSSYAVRESECGVRLLTDMRLPGNLSIGSTELCALLGSALDNAFRAAQAVGRGAAVHMMAKLSDGKLLIQVQNPYVDEVQMENGLPRSKRENGGFGVKSMEAIVEKHGGLSSYEAVDGVFTARFML